MKKPNKAYLAGCMKPFNDSFNYTIDDDFTCHICDKKTKGLRYIDNAYYDEEHGYSYTGGSASYCYKCAKKHKYCFWEYHNHTK